tara:strand:+ start:334 stop:576 length:243 start_codon:yes stop_codon:yes gene_type:complete
MIPFSSNSNIKAPVAAGKSSVFKIILVTDPPLKVTGVVSGDPPYVIDFIVSVPEVAAEYGLVVTVTVLQLFLALIVSDIS